MDEETKKEFEKLVKMIKVGFDNTANKNEAATKNDLEKFATKNDLEKFASKKS